MEVNLCKLKRLTGLSHEELLSKHDEFKSKYPSGYLTRTEFRTMAEKVMQEDEIPGFLTNVFKMFDSNKDRKLDFEEFILATSIRLEGDQAEGSREKLKWLFENVYDKDHSGVVNRSELEQILTSLMRQENIPASSYKEVMIDIFQEMDANRDGKISQREFVEAAAACDLLLKILLAAANRKRDTLEKESLHKN
ncbi:hypothetical protein TCAL_04247 [Tigriopus californicus]|uniref:EF-hand domain-containing protein n=1 Tax=Tigriopus californicus TaxID=6832 RepID=A0A553PKL1_TIGCA|nr:recoverin-like [Tigriopus californicus]TRY78225.1 hypothetical protein TCAL_04247 [Tigriopus californicus]|eukprot:TCALIF_04247-PA protein Name:"Similar to ncaldb Neurocalcin-delta B (Danio rerio)" AED:0.11 eAED:0.11 QI:0/1/0.5/1/1/1/2/12/193